MSRRSIQLTDALYDYLLANSLREPEILRRLRNKGIKDYFIINSGDATATDVEELIEHVRQTVIEKHGVELVHEVRIVGEVAA